MELRQLEYFVTVAEEANFTRAAAKMHVAQPGVSAQIRQLERELGEALLDRSGRTVRLTHVGAVVLPYARAALAAVDGARFAVEELTGLIRGRVAVGMMTACSSLDLPDLLADYHDGHPAVEITLSEADSDHLVEGLLAGLLDVVFAAFVATPPAGVEIQVVADEPIVVAVSHQDPLAARTTITLDVISERALISLPRGTGLRTALDDACTTAGFRPHIAYEAGDPHILVRLAARGLGAAILPASLVGAHPADLHAITITRPRMRGQIALAWRAEGPASPAARSLIAHVRKALTVVADRPDAGSGVAAAAQRDIRR
jgi:DNA-binding transcriptional LysR family regulator